LTLSLVGAVGWLGAAATASAGIDPLIPQLSVTGGTGVPGGTVAVTLALADDVDNSGVSAGVDLRFDAERLEISGLADCRLSERLTSTHQLAGRLVGPSLLNVEIAIQVGPPPPPALGDGELATCDFTIKAVQAGTAALEIESPFLGDADGGDIPVDVVDGFVTIVDQLPTPTPTSTSTPQSTSTATVTNTPAVTNTATATATNTPATTNTASATPTATNTAPTATRTATATATDTAVVPPTATATATRTGATPTATKKSGGGGGGGCNVVPTRQSDATGTAALLLLPALLLWVRRRS
jgi:hypothetical protein